MKDKRSNRHDYAALKRKMYAFMSLTAIVAFLAAVLCRRLTLGMFGDAIVTFLMRLFRLDWDTARRIYWRLIPNYMEQYVTLLAVILTLLLFRPLVNSFMRYFDQIADGVDRLAEGDREEIHLSPELISIESRLNRLSQSLERQESQAREAQRRRDDLMIYSAHDVKTPLTSVLGYLMLLEANPELPREEREKYTRIARDKARELDGMINEMFEMTRYNLHDIRLEKQELDLYSLLLQLKEEHFPQLEAGGKRALLQAGEDIVLLADADKLGRAFNNLMKNAVAYSEPGSDIIIRAQAENGEVTVSFQNKCAPVPQEKLDRLFERFFRLEEGKSANESGAGLGLAIAREIIRLHGGSIRAESLADGIQFTVKLPIE